MSTLGPLKETLRELAHTVIALSACKQSTVAVVREEEPKLTAKKAKLYKALATRGMDYATIDTLVAEELKEIKADAKEKGTVTLVAHNGESTTENGTPNALCQSMEDYYSAARARLTELPDFMLPLMIHQGLQAVSDLHHIKIEHAELWLVMVGPRVAEVEVTPLETPDAEGNAMSSSQLSLCALEKLNGGYSLEDAELMAKAIAKMLETLEGSQKPVVMTASAALNNHISHIMDDLQALVARAVPIAGTEVAQELCNMLATAKTLVKQQDFYMVFNAASSLGEPMFWSGDDGWVGFHDADIFSLPDNIDMPIARTARVITYTEAAALHKASKPQLH